MGPLWRHLVYFLRAGSLSARFLRERSEVIGPGVFAMADARYLGLTPAQWACLPLFALGVTLLARLSSQGREPPAVPPAFSRGDPPRSSVDREGAASDASDEG